MNITTWVFIAVVSFFVWRGYRKGFVASITPILSWLVAYPAAIFFSKPLANLLRQHTALDGVVVYMVAGSLLFFTVSFAVSFLLNRFARSIPQNHFTQTGSKLGGASVGIIFGGVLGLLAVYFLEFVKKPHQNTTELATAAAESSRQINGRPQKDEELFDNSDAPSKDTFIEASAKKMVSTAASTAVDITLDDKTTTQMTRAFTQDPQTMLTHVQQLTNDGQMKALLAKPEFQAQLNGGDVNGLMRNKDFQALLGNEDMQAILASSGEANDEVAEHAAAEKMVAAWQKVDTLKNDPRVVAILNDEAFQQQLNSPNKLSLMMNPKMRELTEIIFSSNGPESPAKTRPQTHYNIEDITPGQVNQEATEKKPPAVANQKSTEDVPEHKIYRWKDADGKIHFSDTPVKEQ